MMLVCRQYLPGTVDDLQPGYTVAHCDICGRKVQISPRSIKAFLDGWKPFCNTCGGAIIDMLGAENICLAMTPEAKEQFDRLIAHMKKLTPEAKEQS